MWNAHAGGYEYQCTHFCRVAHAASRDSSTPYTHCIQSAGIFAVASTVFQCRTRHFHQTILNVRIGLGERYRGFRGWSQHRTAPSAGSARARHDQFSALVRLLDQAKMFRAKRSASFDVIFPNLIEQEDMHR